MRHDQYASGEPGTNWAGTYAYRAPERQRPRSLGELQAIVARAGRVRALGTRHSFTAVADSEEVLVSTLGLPEVFEPDSAAGVVRVSAGMTYDRLARRLDPLGLALANLPSLPHVCVGGAVATGTHGSGERLGGLATQVAGLQLVTAQGDLVDIARHDPDFAGAPVSVGLLGVVTTLDLVVEPAYEVAQWVLAGGSPRDLAERLDEIMAAGDSVSVFTHWSGPHRLFVKRRAPAETPQLDGYQPEPAQVHVLRGGDPAAMTRQGGVPGPWHDRLTHFRADAVPSQGNEIQSEYFVPRRRFADAVPRLVELAPLLAPVLLVSEVRAVAGDDLWLSDAYGEDQVAVHLTLRPEVEQVDAILPAVEEALLPLGARPHWGKRFAVSGDRLCAAYPRIEDFTALARRLDPSGKFTNDYLAGRLGLG